MKAKLILPTTALVLALLFIAATLGGGCETAPKIVNGQRVKATKWIDGQIVYVLEDNSQVQKIMADRAEEARAAAAKVKFAPTK